MIKNHDKNPCEYPILQILNKSESPQGAGAICEALELDYSIEISEAGVGRALRALRKLGYLERQGFQGHCITCEGQEKLRELEEAEKIGRTLKNLMQATDFSKQYSIIDILIARRAIEREAAIQAALKAKPADIRRLENIVSAQYKGMEKGADYTGLSSNFHHEILKIAGVPLLQTLYNFIGLSVQWQGFFIGTFKMYNQPLNRSHEKILDMIKAGDCEGAGLVMSEHLDDVIDNAKKILLMQADLKTD